LTKVSLRRLLNFGAFGGLVGLILGLVSVMLLVLSGGVIKPDGRPLNAGAVFLVYLVGGVCGGIAAAARRRWRRKRWGAAMSGMFVVTPTSVGITYLYFGTLNSPPALIALVGMIIALGIGIGLGARDVADETRVSSCGDR